MIQKVQSFQFKGNAIIEKLWISPPFRYERPYEESACFLYLKEGEGRLFSASQVIPFEKHESILLRCGSYFGDILGSLASQCEIYIIHLQPAVLHEIYKNELPPFLKSGAVENIEKINGNLIIEKFIESLDFYFENPAFVNDDLLQLKLKELILLLVQTKNAKTVQDLISGLFTVRRTAIQEIIQTHLYSDLSVEELAKLANLSLSSFKRDFQQIYNESPANYIKQQRLEKAKELLTVSDQSINEISYQVGFNDLAHFSRSFKKHFGFPPSQLQKQ